MVATEKVTPQSLKCVNTMLSKLGLMGSKRDIIAGASDGRCESSKDLTEAEARQLISYLKSQDPEELAADVMRKKIIAMAYERAGLHHGASKEQKKKVIDQLNGWCVQYGYLHKRLDDYKYNELPALVSQFKAVLNHLLIKL